MTTDTYDDKDGQYTGDEPAKQNPVTASDMPEPAPNDGAADIIAHETPEPTPVEDFPKAGPQAGQDPDNPQPVDEPVDEPVDDSAPPADDGSTGGMVQ